MRPDETVAPFSRRRKLANHAALTGGTWMQNLAARSVANVGRRNGSREPGNTRAANAATGGPERTTRFCVGRRSPRPSGMGPVRLADGASCGSGVNEQSERARVEV